MPDKNILVKLGGGVHQDNAKITAARRVTFFPADSEHAITIHFTNRIPFSDWDCGVKTGQKGKPLTGRVRKDAIENYEYNAFSHPTVGGSGVLANPKLIVDGGGIGVALRQERKPKGV